MGGGDNLLLGVIRVGAQARSWVFMLRGVRRSRGGGANQKKFSRQMHHMIRIALTDLTLALPNLAPHNPNPT